MAHFLTLSAGLAGESVQKYSLVGSYQGIPSIKESIFLDFFHFRVGDWVWNRYCSSMTAPPEGMKPLESKALESLGLRGLILKSLHCPNSPSVCANLVHDFVSSPSLCHHIPSICAPATFEPCSSVQCPSHLFIFLLINHLSVSICSVHF